MKKKRGRKPGQIVNRKPRPPWEVSTAQAAEELATTTQTVIWKMEHGMLPIGDVVRREGSRQCAVTIFRKLLDEYKESRGIY